MTGIGELRNADARPDDIVEIVKRFKNLYTIKYQALVEEVTLTDFTILIWDHPTQGDWDDFNWASDETEYFDIKTIYEYDWE